MAAVVYLFSLALPAAVISSHSFYGYRELSGWDCLTLPLRSPEWLLYPIWWTNPVFFLGCVRLIQGRIAAGAVCGGVCVALALLHWHPTSLFPLPQIGYFVSVLAMGFLILPWTAWQFTGTTRR
jgi:hypothetical protein